MLFHNLVSSGISVTDVYLLANFGGHLYISHKWHKIDSQAFMCGPWMYSFLLSQISRYNDRLLFVSFMSQSVPFFNMLPLESSARLVPQYFERNPLRKSTWFSNKIGRNWKVAAREHLLNLKNGVIRALRKSRKPQPSYWNPNWKLIVSFQGSLEQYDQGLYLYQNWKSYK